MRSLVLWLLRSADVMARDYVAPLTSPAANRGEPTAVPLADDSAAEAVRLAASFRQLAAALTMLAAELTAWHAVAVRGGGLRLGAHVTTNSLAALFCLTPAVERLDSS